MADFGGVARFHPFVEKADRLSEQNEGVGARRKCNFYDGNSVVERVIEWQEGQRIKVELSQITLLMKTATAEFRVVPSGEGECEALLTMHFTPKFGPLGALMGALMMKSMLRKMFSQVLGGLEHHARTGERIGKGGVPIAGGAAVGSGERPATA